MEHIPHVLIVIAITIVHLVIVIVCGLDGCFEAVIGFGQHIECEDIEVTVIVEIRHIGSHGEFTLVLYVVADFIGKSTIPIVDIENIVAQIVIAYINIRPSVVIQIRNGHSKTIAFDGYAGFHGYIGKGIVTIVAK